MNINIRTTVGIILIFCLIVIVFNSAKADEVPTLYLPIIKIVDGDTIKTKITLPPPLDSVYIRILDIDTPEKTWRAKCDKEKDLGIRATIALNWLKGDSDVMKVTNFKWDKFGSRIDGNVEIKGQDVATYLIDKGFAKEYTGRGAKPDWCN